MSTNPSCEYCDKRGVPIFPARYAVALPNANAPALASKPMVALPDASSQYTLRTLRSGYLYVYDEARKRWDDYFVTEDGYFFKTSTQAKGQPLVLPKKPFSCPDEGHRAIASCITIPDAKRATKVWLAFSDGQWTEAVRKRHDSVDYRKKHMRCVDVKAYSASVDAKYCLPIKDAGSKIAEYALDKAALGKAVGFSPIPLASRKGGAERLIAEAEKLAPGKGFIVALSDPVGIAAELSALMIHHASAFANKKENKHPLMASMAISQIKMAVEDQALEAEHQAAEELSNDYISQPDLSVLFSSSARKRREAQYDALRTVTPAEAKRAQKLAWDKYRTKFNEPAMQAWQAKFEAESQKFDQATIQPLAKVYLGWLGGQDIKQSFQCNYDEDDLDSGEAYTRAVTLAVSGAQDKKLCLDHLSQLLSGNFEPENFVLNATVLNQKSLKDQVKKAVGAQSIDPRIFPADAYIGFQGGVAEKIAHGDTSLNAYLLTISAPLVKLFDGIANKVARPLWTAMAMHSQKVFVQVEVTGSKKAFRTRLIKELVKQGGKAMNPREMERAVSAQLRNLQAAGVPLDGTEKKTFTLLLDPKQVRGMPNGLTPSQQAKWLAGSIHTPAQLDNIVMGEWRAALSSAKGAIPFAGGLLAAIWQWAALDKLGQDEQGAMSHEAKEASWRLRAGTTALAGTIVDMAGQGLKKSATWVPKFAKGLSYFGIGVSVIGRLGGLIGGAIMAFWDGRNAYQAAKKGDWGMSILYATSAFLGVIVASMAFAMAVPFIGWIAIVALIGVTLLIELFKDNKIQAWLENGYWGGRTYKNPEEEQKQLELAVAG
ncbi:T6SS effector BTH_I2691 family protein [Chromobacterium violaceum]|uniref:T6SS effector BTH_I2691 family protein n=1 Tax=Chromobacterium violaceum TaxID=536 RepID=UPI000AF39506|nr:T6SS effector BTH_I2691 family protein [Chromobacterium violaceum]